MENNKTFNNGKNVFCVLQFQKKEKAPTCPVDALSKIGFFSYILHDKDTTENGENKGLHAHLYVEALKGMSKASWLEKLSTIFGIETNAVSVEIAVSPSKCIKYLLHRLESCREDGKFQYDEKEIVTNNEELFKEYLTTLEYTPLNQITLNTMKAIKSKEELFELVGFQNFKKAYDVWKIFDLEKTQTNATIKNLSENMQKTLDYIHFLNKQPLTALEKEMLSNIAKMLTLGSFDI